VDSSNPDWSMEEIHLVFNPLEMLGLTGLEIVWDVIAFVISFIIILMLVQINAAIEKSGALSTTVTRKVIHTFAAPLWIVTWILFSGSIFSRWLAMIVPLLFVILFVAIGTGKMINEDFVGSMSRSGNPRELLGGTLYYATMMVIFAIIWFYVPAPGNLAQACPTAIIAFACLAGGDGVADVVGRKYGGEKKFGIGGAEKTIVGSIGMFIGSLLFSIILLLIFSLEATGFSVLSMLVGLIIISIVVTIVEALTPKGLDNITIPIAAVIMVFLMPYLGVPWPYPFLTLF
jgi:phytol kinase